MVCNLLAYISQAIYEHLPCQRQLDVEVRTEAESLLKKKVNKKLLRQHLTEVTVKVIIIVMCMYVSLPMLLLGCDAKGYYKHPDLSVSSNGCYRQISTSFCALIILLRGRILLILRTPSGSRTSTSSLSS